MKKIFVLCTLALFSSACGRRYAEEKPPEAESKEELLKVSQAMVHKEAEDINEFIKRHQWTMTETGSGLRLAIYQQGSGRTPASGDTVSIAYKAYLLDGTLCYEKKTEQPERFALGNGEQINGLEEALAMMKEGAAAHVIVPSHLAYGLSGDGNKIPPARAIYFNLQLLNVENHSTR